MPDYRQSQFSLKGLMQATTAAAVGSGFMAFAIRSLKPEGWSLLIAAAMIGAGAGLIGLGATILFKNIWLSFVITILVTFVAFRALG
jgi:hypothetical protein